jgi:hypothetical protein
MTRFEEYAFDSSEALIESMLGRQLIAEQRRTCPETSR